MSKLEELIMNVFRNNIYVVDIMRCFETIIVNGQGALFEARSSKLHLRLQISKENTLGLNQKFGSKTMKVV